MGGGGVRLGLGPGRARAWGQGLMHLYSCLFPLCQRSLPGASIRHPPALHWPWLPPCTKLRLAPAPYRLGGWVQSWNRARLSCATGLEEMEAPGPPPCPA